MASAHRWTGRRSALLAAALVLLSGCADGRPATSAQARTPPASMRSATTPSPSAPPSTPAPAAPSPAPSPASAPATASPVHGLAPVPASGAGPRVRFPANPPAVGPGANALVGPVPDAVWARMVGYSWTPGCPVGRPSLRYVTVNFWGFDGRRSRGAVVVDASIADRTAQALSRLYALQFRIRQMRVMDSSWGHNPRGPGADDYAAMSADNSSAFNCRYVGGQESRKVWSGHAYGRAVDVNDVENPYVDDAGRVCPDTFFLHRRGPIAGVFSSSRAMAVRAFTDLGFTWGGRWSAPDYQHFEVTR
jgi:hypothetical protein